MAFEKLLNITAKESQLLEMLVSEIQANYFKYQKECYFLKLEKVSEYLQPKTSDTKLERGTSKIVRVKAFEDMYAFGDFYYDTKFQRAAILIKFEKGRYELLCQGFFWSDNFELWPRKIVDSRPYTLTYNCENSLMPSRQFLAQAFGDIKVSVTNSKRNKAV